MANTPTYTDRAINRAQLCELLGGVCSHTITRKIKDEKIPPPDLTIDGRSPRWWASTLIEKKIITPGALAQLDAPTKAAA
jgi:hypothetical protein